MWNIIGFFIAMLIIVYIFLVYSNDYFYYFTLRHNTWKLYRKVMQNIDKFECVKEFENARMFAYKDLGYESVVLMLYDDETSVGICTVNDNNNVELVIPLSIICKKSDKKAKKALKNKIVMEKNKSKKATA